MYLDSEGRIVLAFDGGMCINGCNCRSDNSGLACGKIVATHTGLVGCLAALNGVPIVLCPYFEEFGGTSVCSGYPAETPRYLVAYRGVVDLGGDMVAVVVPGFVELQFGGPSGGQLRNRRADACTGLTYTDFFGTPVTDHCQPGVEYRAVPTLPTTYAGPLTIDPDARTVTAALHATTDPSYAPTSLTWDATASYTELTAEECCDAECTYAELASSKVTTESTSTTNACAFKTTGTVSSQRIAFGYDCANCCDGFQFVYPGGNGPKLSFLRGDASPTGSCLGGFPGELLLASIYYATPNAFGGTGGAISYNYFGVVMGDDPRLPGMAEAWGCVATGSAYVGSDGFDMPDTPPAAPGGADFYGLFGSLTRERATFKEGTDDAWTGAGPVPELRDAWVYREYYACRGGGAIFPYKLRRARWANPQGPCPPTDAGDWNATGGTAPAFGDAPDDATPPDSVTISDCPACGCACGAHYTSHFVYATETWTTPALSSPGGCMPKWDAPLWPDPCDAGAYVNLNNDFLTAQTWKFFATCACDLSGDACTIPTTIDPPDFVPACLKCPTAYPNCCDGYEVTYAIDGVVHIAVIQFGADGTFVSDDDNLTLACRLRLFRLNLTVEGRDGSPFEWIGNDAGFDDQGSCPRTSEDGAGWTPNFDDLGLTINSVRCLKCDADLSDFCTRFGIVVRVDGLPIYVTFSNDGSTFTSSDGRFTLACVAGTGEFKIEAELGRAGDPYIWLGDAVSPPGTPPLSPDGSLWVPQFDDSTVELDEAGCWECNGCCDTPTVKGAVDGVGFCVPMTRDDADRCTFGGTGTTDAGTTATASAILYGTTAFVTASVGKVVGGVVEIKTARFRLTLATSGCLESYTGYVVTTKADGSPSDCTDGCSFDSVVCDGPCDEGSSGDGMGGF